MFVIFSHILAFAVLFVNSLFDLLNDNNVPDFFTLIGISGGILLHIGESIHTGSITPVLWSLSGGAIAGIYAWFAYYKGMWGGADAIIMTMMGFTVPLTYTGEASLIYIVDLIINFMFAAVAVTVVYSGFKFFQGEKGLEKFRDSLNERKRFVSGVILSTGLFSIFLGRMGGNGIFFFSVMTGLILLYEWVKVVEEDFLTEKVEKQEAVDEVPAEGQGFDKKIKGLTEEEVEEFEGEEIEVRTGVPMVPVFLLALIITDLTQLGFYTIYSIY